MNLPVFSWATKIKFFKFFRDNGEANIGMTIEQFVDEFLSQYVC